jgi:hypothetical protein
MTVSRAIPLLLAPAFLVACGSSGGGTTEAPRLTQQEFVTAANQVCIDSDRRVFRIGNLTADPAGWTKTAAAASVGIADMRALRPPASRQAGFDDMLKQAEQLRHAIEDVRDALRKHDFAKARAAQTRATTADTKIKHQASALGLTFCEQLLTNWPA